MTLNSHINRITNQVDNTIRALYPLLCRNSVTNDNTKLLVYKLYIRPILTYAAPILDKICNNKLKILETKQNKVLRMLLKIDWQSRTTTEDVHKMSRINTIRDALDSINKKFYDKCKNSDNRIIMSMTR